MHVLTGEVVGVFAHVERAHEHGAGGFEPRDQRRVARGRRAVAINLGAGERRQPRNVEQVLDRERHAGEWPELPAVEPRVVNCPRLRQGAVLEHGGEGIEHRIVGGNARERRAHHRARARAARANGRGNLARMCAGAIHQGAIANVRRMRE